MARTKEHQQDSENERMTAAMRRLESLLRETERSMPSEPPIGDAEATEGEPERRDPEPMPDAKGRRTARAGRTYQHVWTSKAEAGPKPPPSRPGKQPSPELQTLAPVIAANDAARLPEALRVSDTLIVRIAGVDDGPAADALNAASRAVTAATAFSAAISVLWLVGPLSVMAIVDRLMVTRSFEGLALLSGVMVSAAAVAMLLDLARSRVLARAGAGIDDSLRSAAAASSGMPIEDARSDVRRFFLGGGAIAALDALFAVFAIIASCAIDLLIGLAGFAAAAILTGLASAAAKRADAGAEIPLRASDRCANAAIASRGASVILSGLVLALAASVAMSNSLSLGGALAGFLLIAHAMRQFEKLAPCLIDLAAARTALKAFNSDVSDTEPSNDSETAAIR